MAALLESLAEDRQDMGQNVIIVDPRKLENLAPLRARPLSVRRCLDNVLDNAVWYGGVDGSPARVEIDVEDRADTLAVIIRDHGSGIPEEYREKVFQPFYRLEPSRNRTTGGSGLGLAIVRAMTRQHGGMSPWTTLRTEGLSSGSASGGTPENRANRRILSSAKRAEAADKSAAPKRGFAAP